MQPKQSLCKACLCTGRVPTILMEGVSAGTPSTNAQAGGNATVAVIREKDVKNAKKAAKAAQKAMEFNKAFGGQAETIV